jgi:hypothetical protein
MPVALHLDHRLALVLLCVLILSAAAPLAYGWARLLPEDAPPFQPAKRGDESAAETGETGQAGGNPIAIVLLVCLTVSFLLQVPGVPIEHAVESLTQRFSQAFAERVLFAGGAFFVFVPGLAACYALLRKNFLRWPLVIGGALVLVLWLLSDPLMAALLGN